MNEVVIGEAEDDLEKDEDEEDYEVEVVDGASDDEVDRAEVDVSVVVGVTVTVTVTEYDGTVVLTDVIGDELNWMRPNWRCSEQERSWM